MFIINHNGRYISFRDVLGAINFLAEHPPLYTFAHEPLRWGTIFSNDMAPDDIHFIMKGHDQGRMFKHLEHEYDTKQKLFVELKNEIRQRRIATGGLTP